MTEEEIKALQEDIEEIKYPVVTKHTTVCKDGFELEWTITLIPTALSPFILESSLSKRKKINEK
jgi:hypothetical protein